MLLQSLHKANHEAFSNANEKYMGAVQNFSNKIDNLGEEKEDESRKERSEENAKSEALATTEAASRAIASDAQQKLNLQLKALGSKKEDLKQILRQIDSTTDPAAKGKLTNDAEAMKDSIDKMEASTDAMSGAVQSKLRMSTEKSKEVADELASRAVRARENVQAAQEKEKSNDMRKANQALARST